MILTLSSNAIVIYFGFNFLGKEREESLGGSRESCWSLSALDIDEDIEVP